MRRLYYLSVSILLFVSISNTVYSQQKELDKLKSIIRKGKLEKAKDYCDKVTPPYSPKKKGRFYALLAKAFYNKKEYENAAKAVLKSEDHQLAFKLAKEFDNSENKFYDINTTIELYRKGKKYERTAELLFQEAHYKDAAVTCPSETSKMKYGDSLFNMGKIDGALHFYKRAKKKGEKFSSEKVLDYYYQKKDYALVYTILNYNERDFKIHIQGSIIDKMFEHNQSMDFVNHFLDSIKMTKNDKDEVIIEALINNKMFDKAENYCMELKEPYKKMRLTSLANKISKSHPDVSARVNLKLGNSYIAKGLLTTYMIETAIGYNDKWSHEPIDKELLKSFFYDTKPSVEKCGHDYCKFMLHVIKKCDTKVNNFVKDDPKQSEEHTRAGIFLQQVKLVHCK